jgi:hypothetical protein
MRFWILIAGTLALLASVRLVLRWTGLVQPRMPRRLLQLEQAPPPADIPKSGSPQTCQKPNATLQTPFSPAQHHVLLPPTEHRQRDHSAAQFDPYPPVGSPGTSNTAAARTRGTVFNNHVLC